MRLLFVFIFLSTFVLFSGCSFVQYSSENSKYLSKDLQFILSKHKNMKKLVLITQFIDENSAKQVMNIRFAKIDPKYNKYIISAFYDLNDPKLYGQVLNRLNYYTNYLHNTLGIDLGDIYIASYEYQFGNDYVISIDSVIE